MTYALLFIENGDFIADFDSEVSARAALHDFLAENPSVRDRVGLLMFGEDGIHFAWGRIPMGSSDYAMDRYTLNETANDTTMANFSIERDKEKLIPYIKAAQAINPDLRFWASPWTPPTWMKASP